MDEKITENNWDGYTLDEIRVKRLVCLTRIEMEKAKVAGRTNNMFGKQATAGGHSLVGKLLGALDYVDYAIIAFSVGKRALRLLRRHR